MDLKNTTALNTETEQLLVDLSRIKQAIEDAETKIDQLAATVHKDHRLSAKNLLRYIILRNFDLRTYHPMLSELGVSSLRSAEGYVYCNLFHVIRNIKYIQQHSDQLEPQVEWIGFQTYRKLVQRNALRLFGPGQDDTATKIMVTLPDEAATDKDIIKNMAINGMDIARINLSHGNLEMWKSMLRYIHEVRAELGVDLKIYMDLAGPKIRTSDIEIPRKKKNKKPRNSIPVREGEHILLRKKGGKGRKSKFTKSGRQTRKAVIGVTLPQILEDIKVGDRVMFDDGMIRGVVKQKKKDSVEILLTDCHKPKLASRKGINLPDTQLNLPALTEEDIEHIPFVCKHADILGYSFVRTAGDVHELYEQLTRQKAGDIGVVFKIENKEAFENLSPILLEGMKHRNIGVMIARGDLAVEIGFQRISEVQNELLWLCASAHVPVIWATQVLENMAKTGIPTRAEISDAVKGVKANCIMLNKGPFIDDAILSLKDILHRMDSRKNALRALHVARRTFAELIEG